MYSKVWLVASFLAWLPAGLSAETAPFCERLDQAMGASGHDETQATTVVDLLTGFGPSPAICTFSVDLTGSRSANCNWALPYRSERSTHAFEDMLALLSDCADPEFGIESDKPVNHPDSYDLRVLRIVGGDVGLSLKDKAALDQTYIFLRLTPTP